MSPEYTPKENPIIIKCQGNGTLPIDALQQLQGELKKLSRENRDKLLASICEKGFIAPFFVWNDAGDFRLLDGHQRLKTLDYMRRKGWQIPELPVVYIDADNETDAREKLLLITSQYGEFTLEGFKDFSEGFNLQTDFVNLASGTFKLPKEEQETLGDDEIPDQEKKVYSKPGEIYQLGDHLLLCGDATKKEDVEKVLGGEKADLWITDPPYNVDYEGKTKDALKIKNDKQKDSVFQAFLTDAFTAAVENLRPGGVFYIWHADSEGFNFRTAMKNAGLTTRQCLIWNKNCMVMGRQDYQWKHEPCQLPGTKIIMEGGISKKIEDIQAGERIVGLEKASLQLTGWKKTGTGKNVNAVASRDYDGIIYWIGAEGNRTNATDNHKFTVRYNAKEASKYFVYLMKRGDWWRIGISQLRNSRGSGMRDRLRGEKGEAIWVISRGFDSKSEAMVLETALSCKYGIPQTVWTTDKCQRNLLKNDEQIGQIYKLIGKDRINAGVKDILGARINYPQIVRGEGFESTRNGFQVEACNLISLAYDVLIPAKQAGGTIVAAYKQIKTIERQQYSGKVYSLDVEGKHYISDGIITHNCLYGWKDGAGHYWSGGRSQTTVFDESEKPNPKKMDKDALIKLCTKLLEAVQTTIIDVDKPSRSAEHPTMKPVRLFQKQIENSSARGELVLDTFAGSGTTVIACEKIGRKARVIELDSSFCDVIRRRWTKWSEENGIDPGPGALDYDGRNAE